MTSTQWQRVRELFEALVECDDAEARARLAAEAHDDPLVKAEVASLLDNHSRAGSFLAAPLALEALGIGGGLAEGASIGPYTVVREIGRGGMGCVYLATDARLERSVCLKAVRADIASNPAHRERLRREARLAASLSHPGICAVYALEESDGDLYLVTEFVEGPTLREEIVSGRRPDASHVADTMKELAAALGAAHAKGITHRDLKPENVIRSSDGRLKILDFGLARMEDASQLPKEMATVPGTVVGTLAYMAPEQINGEVTDRRADLFALGVLIYEWATGVHPFTAPTPLATVARIVEHQPEPLHERRPDIPRAVSDAVGRCLEKRPDARFDSAADIITALASGQSVPSRRAASHTWWQLHHAAAIALYLTACIAGWQFKEWEPSATSRWAFLAIGVFSAINGVIRGHLLFTHTIDPRRVPSERRRTRLVSLGLDLVIAAALFAVAALVSASHAVAAALGMGLAAGIATAAVFIEPATSAAAFNER